VYPNWLFLELQQSFVVLALPPRRQQLLRSQFLIRLHGKINTLLALSFLQVFGEAEDVSVAEFLARYQVWRALKADSHFPG